MSTDRLGCCPLGEYFTFSSGTAECVTLDSVNDNCSEYNNSTNLCMVCDANFYLTSGFCCAEGELYNSVTSACEAITATNCARSDGDDVCKQCDVDYFLIDSDKSCELYAITDCFVQQSYTMCQTCKKWSYPDNSGARTVCTVYDKDTLHCFPQVNTNICEFCYYGYFKNGNVCDAITVSNCLDQEVNQDKCTSCMNEDYYLDGNNCTYHNVANCLEYTDFSNTCTLC